MPDPLYSAIERAIDGPLAGATFERCAVDLLREAYYPTLRPIEPNKDAGMDGLGELPDGERFVLMSTVSEDARSNLDRNITSYLKNRGDRRTVVFATSRRVGGEARAKLTSYLEDSYGFRLWDVHDRGDFVQLLYRNSAWRKELLGVPGLARALTRLPANYRPTPEIPLIGRDEDLQRLRSASGDLVLVGKPGVGKTYLLQTLMAEDWGLFDAGWDNIADLEDAIRDLRPSRVVLDDAHLDDRRRDRLAVLRRLRAEMGAEFGIVAVTWPGQRQQVLDLLPGSSIHEARELDRGQILEVITHVGVTGPRDLQAQLVDQALGRAGLAVTLAHACISGHVREVATAGRLLTDIVGWFTRSLGPKSRHVLGVLALSGDGGTTSAQVSTVLGLDISRASDLVGGLASGGTVDEIVWPGQAARMRVQPETLRYALVRDVFFGGPGSLDVHGVLAQFDRPSDAVLPLIGAAYRGASVDRALLRQLVDGRNLEAVTAYALLGHEETNEALAFAPQHQAAIAREAYRHGISPERTLRILMDLAVGDRREEHTAPDHPLRIVSDYLHHPDVTLDARKLAVSVAGTWLRDGGDPEVALRVMLHAMHPGVRRVSSDPGLGNTVTITEAALPIPAIRQLAQLWDSVLDVVEEVRPGAVAPLLRALHPWVYPYTLAVGRAPDPATAAAIREVARRVISRLSSILRDRPGALRSLRDYAHSAGLALTFDIPPGFAALFPADWDGTDESGGYAGWSRRADDAVRRLAAEYAQMPESEIAAWITAADTEAAAAGIGHRRLTWRLAQLLAEGTDRPELLLDALERRGAAGDVLLPFLDRLVALKANGWGAAVERLLADDRTAGIAVQVALTRPVGANLKDRSIDRLTAAHSALVDCIVARGEADADTLGRLLDAPDRMVARATAVALTFGSDGALPPGLPETLQRRWRDVIVECPADEYWYSRILRRDPVLFADWLRAHFTRLQQPGGEREFLPHTMEEAIEDLPIPLRAQLIEDLPSGIEPVFVQDAVTSLIAGDVGVAAALFDRADLRKLHQTALRDGPSEAWMELAFMALDRGWEPARIASATMFAEDGWIGEESQHWREKIDAFEALRRDGRDGDPRRDSIIAAGVRLFERLRSRAAERERQERVFGH